MALRGILRGRLGFSGQEAENYWENISFLHYYPNERRVEIHPGGVRVDISPVKEVIARKPDRVISYVDPVYTTYEYPRGDLANVIYEPHAEIVRMWTD